MNLPVTVSAVDDVVSRSRRRTLALEGGVPMIEVLAAARRELDLPAGPACVLVDGVPVECPEAFGPVPPGASVLLAPVPRDPGTALLVGLALVTAVAGAALAPRVRAGALSSSGDAEGRRFGFNRVSHDAVAGDVIPVVMGSRKRYGGKVIAKVPGEHADGSGESTLKLLLCLGHGPVQRIGNRTAAFNRVPAEQLDGIFLNDQPIANFPGVKASARFGQVGQSAIPGFDDTEILREVGVGGVALRNTSGSDRTGPNASGEAFLFSTATPVDAAVVRVRFPDGLYALTSTSQLDPRRVQYRARTRATAGPGAWSAWTVFTLERAEQSEFFSSPRLGGLGGVASDIQVERVTAEPTGIGVVDAMIWDSVVEVQDTTNTYPGTVILALELVAQDQLTAVPSVSVEIDGLKGVRIWDGVSPITAPVFVTGFTRNPAWLALELLTNTTWGTGHVYGDARIDMPSLIAWAQYCDEQVATAAGGLRPRFRFDFVLEDDRAPIDWLRTICAAGRCLPVTSGGKWRFIVDREQAAPVEIFTDGSIALDAEGVARFEYVRELGTRGINRPNRLVGQLENAGADGEPELVEYPALGELWLADEPVAEQTVKLEGITDPEQAMAELIYRMGLLRFVTRSVTFETVRPVVSVQPGDRFDLAMSMPGWGLASGRLQAGATTTAVRLDRTVTLAPATSYVLDVQHHDGTREVRAVTAPAGTYAAGAAIAVAALSAAPAEFAEYALGRVDVQVKPFVCTGVDLAERDGLVWRIRGREYVEEVYSGEPGAITLPTYSSLASPSTPPGPVVDLRAREIRRNTTPPILTVELSWRQRPEDEENTASFRVYRRRTGTTTWILVPEPRIARRAAVIELTDLDVAYEFAVVAVSLGGAYLSPFDPRVPIAQLVIGLAAEPPPPPGNLTLTLTGGNTYRLAWDEVEDAVGYQVLFGGDTTVLPNAGAEDCLVLARTTDPQLPGLELPPGRACRFWVRSVGANGRLSFTAATMAITTPATPAGETIKHTLVANLAGTGTPTNLVWDAGQSRLELVSASAPGSWESAEIDTGSLSLTELTWRPGTANDAADPAVTSDPFTVPSIAADQWGIVDDDPADVVGMLMPPYPDGEQAWRLQVRTHDGVVWSDYEDLLPLASIRRTFRRYRVKITLSRNRAPYRPALRSLAVVCTH